MKPTPALILVNISTLLWVSYYWHEQRFSTGMGISVAILSLLFGNLAALWGFHMRKQRQGTKPNA